MSKKLSYLVPSEAIELEQEIKKSRFIASISRVVDKNSANEFISKIKEKYPDARHHCYAFIAGCPGNTSEIGMSDDGEPQGTAGKPMLSILQYSDIGEIVAVVTRYFGGTKLGTGGLVRAYSSTVQMALDKLKTEEFVELGSLCLSFSYSYESAIRYVFEKFGNIEIKEILYQDKVTMYIELPESITEVLVKEIKDKTRGEIEIRKS